MNTYSLSYFFYENFSDPRIEKYQLMKDYNYTIEEVNEFIKKTGPFYNPKAEEIFKFFIEFKGGIFYPEKWNTYEPIRNSYTEDSNKLIVEHLSYPTGNVFIKKKRKFCIWFKNNDFGFWWKDKTPMRPCIKCCDNFKISGDVYKTNKEIKLTDLIELTDEVNKRFHPFWARIIDTDIKKSDGSIFSGSLLDTPPDNAIVYEPQSYYPEIKKEFNEHLNQLKNRRPHYKRIEE